MIDFHYPKNNCVYCQSPSQKGYCLILIVSKRGPLRAIGIVLDEAGWVEVGVIPNYAMNPDGSWCDTVVFYKALR